MTCKCQSPKKQATYRVRESRRARAGLMLALALGFGCVPTFAADYTLKQKFAIGGEGGWDYLAFDASSHRLFISRATHVQVVDPDSGTVLADIPDTPGVHGIALADDLGRGFISNGGDNSITVFDLKTLGSVTKIRTEGGEAPDFIAYDAISKRVFAFNGRSHNASVIDAIALKLVATIPLGGKPESAVADGTGTVFDNIEDQNEVAALDARKAVLVNRWPVTGCERPAAMAIDRETRRLFVGCHNKVLAVMDADSGRVIATLPIGDGVDAGAFDSGAKLVFSSQGDGTMTVIREDSADQFVVLQNVATQAGARTLALNPENHDVYLVSADFEEATPAMGQQRARRIVKPNTLTLLVVSTRQ